MNRFQFNVKRYLPTILSLLGCAGVVGTAYVAIKNNEKYERDIHDLENVGVKEFHALGESEPYYVYDNADGISFTKVDFRQGLLPNVFNGRKYNMLYLRLWSTESTASSWIDICLWNA